MTRNERPDTPHKRKMDGKITVRATVTAGLTPMTSKKLSPETKHDLKPKPSKSDNLAYRKGIWPSSKMANEGRMA